MNNKKCKSLERHNSDYLIILKIKLIIGVFIFRTIKSLQYLIKSKSFLFITP
jgi:hypothetical protein